MIDTLLNCNFVVVVIVVVVVQLHITGLPLLRRHFRAFDQTRW